MKSKVFEVTVWSTFLGCL